MGGDSLRGYLKGEPAVPAAALIPVALRWEPWYNEEKAGKPTPGTAASFAMIL